MCPDRKAFARAIQNWASQSECHPSGALAQVGPGMTQTFDVWTSQRIRAHVLLQVWFPINNEDGSTSLRTQASSQMLCSRSF